MTSLVSTFTSIHATTKSISTSKITYTYNGNTCINFMGNYWSDYSGNDTNDNGIGDIPYNLDSNKDIYPLIDPIEHYLELIEKQKGLSYVGFA
jgi:hypothetical protein